MELQDQKIIDLLLEIKSDISDIKGRTSAYEKAQSDTEKDIKSIKDTIEDFKARIRNLELKKTFENDSKYKKLVALFAAGCTGIVLSNFSEIVKFIITLFTKVE